MPPRDEWNDERKRQQGDEHFSHRLEEIEREPIDERVRDLGQLVDELENGL